VEDLSMPELTDEQMEGLCLAAEKAAREYVLTKVSSKKIERLDISAEADGKKPVELRVEVEITLSSSMKHYDVRNLVDDAVRKAFSSAEEQLREMACHSHR
jgi:hypothetical protein